MSKQDRVFIVPEAKKDIRTIVLYIAKDLAATNAALALQDEFQEAIRSLANMPSRHKLIEEQPWGKMGVRKTRVKNYYIYYYIDENNSMVNVLSVIYVGRDQSRQLNQIANLKDEIIGNGLKEGRHHD